LVCFAFAYEGARSVSDRRDEAAKHDRVNAETMFSEFFEELRKTNNLPERTG
jgi:hypothetical protein